MHNDLAATDTLETCETQVGQGKGERGRGKEKEKEKKRT
jgi:hypothetical protein